MKNISKKSIADCLQTRFVDYRPRLNPIRGELEPETLEKIDQALKVVIDIH
jgi:mRNA interferase MazF